ncbi:MAG: DUF3386 domain-containing protein [Synechococcales cyanobacterium C42_A2020_086]|jgi:hypothetical protein|nr:DUF3386 domain-containing protein [Synechococcales cyanobacterium M58_A2018_015]MBF2075754.1 DUF3386 domain-containing protein [Synechococcales cyanobacterium C42_A2020_086]
MTEKLEARDLFRAAYENRYTWDADFPGYTADVTYREGEQTYTGKVRINADLSYEVTDIEDETGKKAIQNQVWEIAVHRVRHPFEKTHAANTFSYGATDETGAVEILVGGKAEGDRYKIRNNEVCMVHRHIHGVVVTINTFSSHQTEEGYLSHRYDSVYHDPKTGEQKGGISDFEDLYEKVGKYYILTQRTICSTLDGREITSEFSFSNIKLLQPATVA